MTGSDDGPDDLGKQLQAGDPGADFWAAVIQRAFDSSPAEAQPELIPPPEPSFDAATNAHPLDPPDGPDDDGANRLEDGDGSADGPEIVDHATDDVHPSPGTHHDSYHDPQVGDDGDAAIGAQPEPWP